jgi:hypothetical protein
LNIGNWDLGGGATGVYGKARTRLDSLNRLCLVSGTLKSVISRSRAGGAGEARRRDGRGYPRPGRARGGLVV